MKEQQKAKGCFERSSYLQPFREIVQWHFEILFVFSVPGGVRKNLIFFQFASVVCPTKKKI